MRTRYTQSAGKENQRVFARAQRGERDDEFGQVAQDSPNSSVCASGLSFWAANTTGMNTSSQSSG